MKKTFKKFIASISCLAMLSTMGTLNASATIYSNVDDDMVGGVLNVKYGETIDIPLNNGETFPLYSWDYVLRDDNKEIVGYITSSLGERSYTIFKGELYDGLPIFDENDNLVNLYQFGEDLRERYPEYDLPPKDDNYSLNRLIFDLDGNYVGYNIYQQTFDSDGTHYKEVTLLNGETIEVPNNENSVTSSFSPDGELLWYQWNNVSEPCYPDNEDTTIGDSSTIGDSTTLGDSDYYQQFIDAEPTNIRGDINYDGKVNSADILFLRRYLLHLLKW